MQVAWRLVVICHVDFKGLKVLILNNAAVFSKHESETELT